MRFRREEIDTFAVTDLDLDPVAGAALLRYAFEGGPAFEERVGFGRPATHLGPGELTGLERALRLLHLAAGVSYYKAAAPPIVEVRSGALTPAEARWCHALYDKGLREFAYRNELPIPRPVAIHAPTGAVDRPPGPPPPGLAVAVGGGKDSIVVVEALRDRRPLLVNVHGRPAARRTAATAGLELAVLERAVDPALLALNGAGALNGHVPVTAIVSLLIVASGYVHGYDTTALSLERSADEPTRRIGASEVNHQWSKSSEAEDLLAAALADALGPTVRCRSALRQASDFDIAAAFAALPWHHDGFRSCNRAFALRHPLDGWCGDCPKCRFVFLTLALFMARPAVVEIFGADLLADPGQVEGFRDLLDDRRKPFECVGGSGDSRRAVGVLLDDPAWSGAAVLQALRPDLAGDPPPDLQVMDPVELAASIRRAVDAPPRQRDR